MINKTNILEAVFERLKKLPEGHYLDMRTYKRNRKVLLVRQAGDAWLVIQDGFEKKRFEGAPEASLKKLLKTLLAKEFPRSAKIRLYVMGAYDPEEAAKSGRKVL